MIDVRSRPMARPKLASFRGSPVSHAGRAGFVAALIMLGVQLLWRNEWSKGGMIHSFPEFIVAAVARLTPLSLFGAITENVDSLAKKSLFVTILVATAAVGYGAGVLAERLSRRIAPGIVGRLAAGFAVTGGLILVTGLVVLPVSHNGVFATDNSHTGGVLLRLTVTFAIYAVVWALLATTAVDGKAAPASEPVSRRVALRRGAWGVATLAALAGLGSTSWRLLNPAKEVVSDDPLGIVAQQRAAEVQPATAGPTPTRVAGAAVQDVAALNAVDAEQDSTALFAQLDAGAEAHPGPDLGRRLLPRLQEHRRSGRRSGRLDADDRRHGRPRAGAHLRPAHRPGDHAEDHHPGLHLQRAQRRPGRHGGVDGGAPGGTPGRGGRASRARSTSSSTAPTTTRTRFPSSGRSIRTRWS